MSGQTDPTSTGKPGQCVSCPDRVAIYTCPRCATQTCSLPCSAAHKTRSGCSGVREKAKFVPMNCYTHGTMMDDYVFLEDMSRKAGEWGQDIVRGGYGYGYGTLQGRGRGRAPPPPRGKTRNGSGISRNKRDILKSQLELRDIEMDLLPSGMERRTLSQSTWDLKYVGFQQPSLGCATELGS
jgi:HIT zinc finger